MLIVEISGPGSAVMDRAVKPELYGRAGIRYYLRVELGQGAPSAMAYALHEAGMR